MKELTDKIQIIYKPFVIIVIGFILTYTFLHWLLIIYAGIPLKESIAVYILPAGLSLLPVFIWLRPRIKLLIFKNEKGFFAYFYMAWVFILISAIPAQEYLITASGKLTQLNNISQISMLKKTKYYSIEKYYIDKQDVGLHFLIYGDTKSRDKYNIYVTIPILENNTDTVNTERKYWIGIKYSKEVSKRASDDVRKKEFDRFVNQSQSEFEKTTFSGFTYFEVIGNNFDRDKFITSLEKSGQQFTPEHIFFKAHTEPFEDRNGTKMTLILWSLGIGFFIYFIFLLYPKFEQEKLEEFKNRKTTR